MNKSNILALIMAFMLALFYSWILDLNLFFVSVCWNIHMEKVAYCQWLESNIWLLDGVKITLAPAIQVCIYRSVPLTG